MQAEKQLFGAQKRSRINKNEHVYPIWNGGVLCLVCCIYHLLKLLNSSGKLPLRPPVYVLSCLLLYVHTCVNTFTWSRRRRRKLHISFLSLSINICASICLIFNTLLWRLFFSSSLVVLLYFLPSPLHPETAGVHTAYSVYTVLFSVFLTLLVGIVKYTEKHWKPTRLKTQRLLSCRYIREYDSLCYLPTVASVL